MTSEMDGIFDSSRSHAMELERQILVEAAKFFPSGLPSSVTAIIDPLKELLGVFREELTSLSFFMDCVQKWSDAHKVVLNLDTLLSEIEDTVGGIANNLAGELLRVKNAPPPKKPWFQSTTGHALKVLDESAVKMIDVFSTSSTSLGSLKMDIINLIEPARNSLLTESSHCFRCENFYEWDEFVRSTKINLESIQCSLFPDLARRRDSFTERMYSFTNYLVGLVNDCLYVPVMVQVEVYGTVIICGGLVFCDYWCRGKSLDDQEATRMACILSDLQLRIDFLAPSFVDSNLRLLRRCHAIRKEGNQQRIRVKESARQVDAIVKFILGSRGPQSLYLGMKSLLTLFIDIQEEDADNVQRFSTDVKELIIKLASLKNELRLVDDGIQLHLLADIWLIKIEIFLSKQSIAATSLLLLNEDDRCLALEKGMTFLISFLTVMPQQEAENAQQTLVLQEELAIVVGSLNDSFHTTSITRILLKYLVKITLLMVKSFVVKAYRNGISKDHLKERIKFLLLGLEFLALNIIHLPHHKLQERNLLRTPLKALTREAAKLISVPRIHGSACNFELVNEEVLGLFQYSLSSYSFQYHSVMHDLDDLKDLVNMIKSTPQYTRVLSSGLTLQIRSFANRLASFRTYLCHVKNAYLNIPEVEHVRLYFVNVAARTALVFCEYWFMVLEPDEDNATDVLRDLQKEIYFTNRDFVTMNLRLLRRCKGDAGLLAMFVKCLLDWLQSNELSRELITLITFFTHMAEGPANDVVNSSMDITNIIVKLGHHLETLNQEYREVVMNYLLADIWLIKVEIFLRGLLNCPNSFLLSNERGYQLPIKKTVISTTYPRDDYKENMEQIVCLHEEVASSVASLKSSSLATGTKTQTSRNLILRLLVIVMLFKVKLLLQRFLSCNKAQMPIVKDQTEALVDFLEFLKTSINYLPYDKLDDGNILFMRIEAIARRVLNSSAGVAQEVEVCTPYLLEEITLIKELFKEVFLLHPMYNFPKTGALGFFGTLLPKLAEWLNFKRESSASVDFQLKGILSNLAFLAEFLKNLQEHEVEVQELGNLRTRIIDAAYEIEYFIDSISVGLGDEWHDSLRLYHLQEETKLLKNEVIQIHAHGTREKKIKNPVWNSISKMSHDNNPRVDKFVVNLIDQEEAIIDQLLRGSFERKIVSIVGMPGIGKTTLAKKLYNHPKVMHNFHARAWCYVSQRYEKRRLLLEILNLLGGAPVDNQNQTDDDLDAVLSRRLREKKYLIVMDDVWDIGAFHALNYSFPDDGNRSRILITSRYNNVALQAQPGSEPHPLRLLSVDESWKLLQMKIFYDKSCPESFVQVGKEIAAKCEGLPLAVVAVAGFLERTDRSKDHWEQIVKHLSSLILNDPETRCKDILELSYNHLPDHLKACFLYFGALAVDKDIPASKLTWLWMAEGFITETQSHSYENVAESYLKDLISRSLVKVTKERSKGGAKACHIHDLLRDLCLSKAREENFLKLVASYEDTSTAFDGFDFSVDVEDSYSSDNLKYEDHRLCFFSKRKPFVMSKPCGSRVRSLLFNALSDTYPTRPFDLSFISVNFKLLKVLDLECINPGGSFPSGIELLVHLKYLAICGDIESVPLSIDCLRNLETFLVKGLMEKVVLPGSIWHMARLRHLHIDKYAVFSLQDTKLDILHNLVTFSSPILPFAEEIDKMTRRVPNLKKLKCVFAESRHHLGKNTSFLKFDLLAKLESLSIFCLGKAPTSCEFYYPLNLEKLTLSNFRLPWKQHISVIGNLPNLKVLKLLSKAFEGEKWNMQDGEFCELKFLEMQSLDIVQWNASSDSLPKLQHLILRSCKQLEEVPALLGEIPTLQTVELHQCAHSCEESVEELVELNERLQVFINPSVSDKNWS